MLIKVICQKCGKESDIMNVKNQYSLSMDISKQWGIVRFFPKQYGPGVEYSVCPDCKKKLNLPNYTSQQESSLGDKIFDVFYEIAEQAVQENQE